MDIMLAEEVAQELWDLDVTPWNNHWAPVFRNFSRQLVREAQLSPGQLVLDVGTGTGIAAFEAAEQLRHGFVIGIDRSTKMISAARAHNIEERTSETFSSLKWTEVTRCSQTGYLTASSQTVEFHTEHCRKPVERYSEYYKMMAD